MTEQDGFARTVARSFVITGLASGVSKGLSAIALFVVLKLLSREDMGLASLVLAVFGILQAVTELGLGVALVQAKDLTRRQIDSLFWLGAGLAGCVYLALLALAPLVAWFYDAPELAPLLRVQGLSVVVFALYLVPRNLMVRDLQFGRLAVIDNVSLLASSLLMIGLSWAGYGAWALIGADVGNRVAQLVLTQALRPWLPRLQLRLSEVRGLVHFGLYATGSRLLYNFYVNADYLVVGKYFGSEVTGVYFVAYRIVSDPVQTLAAVVNQVAYPAFARLQDQLERLRRYYDAIARATLTFIGVVLVTLAVWLEAALLALGYEQWLAAVPLVRVFAIFGLFRCVGPLVPQLLNARGQARLSFLFSLAGAVVMPAAFLAGAQLGVMGVAWAWGAVYPLLVVLLCWFGSLVLEVSLASFIRRTFAGIVPLVPVLALALGLDALLAGASPWARLLGGGLGTLLPGLALAFVRERETLSVMRRRRSTPAAPDDDPSGPQGRLPQGPRGA